MMVETMAGKSSSLHGLAHDCTPFIFSEDHSAVDYFGKMLVKGKTILFFIRINYRSFSFSFPPSLPSSVQLATITMATSGCTAVWMDVSLRRTSSLEWSTTRGCGTWSPISFR